MFENKVNKDVDKMKEKTLIMIQNININVKIISLMAMMMDGRTTKRLL